MQETYKREIMIISFVRLCNVCFLCARLWSNNPYGAKALRHSKSNSVKIRKRQPKLICSITLHLQCPASPSLIPRHCYIVLYFKFILVEPTGFSPRFITMYHITGSVKTKFTDRSDTKWTLQKVTHCAKLYQRVLNCGQRSKEVKESQV